MRTAKIGPDLRLPLSGYITARDQSMVESGVTEGVKTLPVFTFGNEHNKGPLVSFFAVEVKV